MTRVLPGRQLGAALLALAMTLCGTLGFAGPALAQSTGGSGDTTGAAPGTGGAAPAASGTGTAVGLIQADSTARVDFGSQIQFQVRAIGAEPIANVLFLYQVDDSDVQNTGVPAYQPGAVVTATYPWRVAGVLAPGSEVRYQWQIETTSGKQLTTAEQSVTYNDTRFNWREAHADQATVYYRDGDGDTGQALLDQASKTEKRLTKDFGLTADRPIKIYAYTRQQDLISALGGRPADAALTIGSDRIFVLAPSGTSAMNQALKALSREVGAAIFAQKTRNPYSQAPQWLAQGFALYVGGEELTPDYYKALQQVAQQNQLLPLKTLNGNFPNGDRDRALATVESLSAVKYMVDTYGADKMRSLFAAFRDGNTVDDAVKKGLGVTFDQFETRWKNSLKSGAAAKAASQRTPSGTNGSASGDSVVDRLFGPAVQFWEGIFGAYTRPVLIAAGGLVCLGLVTVVGGSIVGAVRKANAEE
jgi:hypothetical protein